MSGASTRFDDDPERFRFMELACAALVHIWAGRLQQLPRRVGEGAYDRAMDTIVRRAIAGVEGFRDELGAQCFPKILQYVRATVGHKVTSALEEEGLPTTPYNDDIGGAAPAPVAADELDEHCRFEAQLEDARAQLERIRLDDLARDERRLRLIDEGLREHGVKSHARAIVMARATIARQHNVTVDGVTCEYLAPATWSVIAESLGDTSGNARQVFLRTMRRLPDGVRALIRDPASFDG